MNSSERASKIWFSGAENPGQYSHKWCLLTDQPPLWATLTVRTVLDSGERAEKPFLSNEQLGLSCQAAIAGAAGLLLLLSAEVL
jgi:hypothetical protein